MKDRPNYKGRKGIEPLVRFWALVDKSEGCWDWAAATDKDGYGKFWCNVIGNQVHAHRWIYMQTTGRDLPPEIMVCHRCDNPRCVRIDHLFEGAAKVNNDDKASKNRTKGFASMKGEEHTQAKLNYAKVREIREFKASGARNADLSKAYNIDASVISRIVNYKIWIEPKCHC